VGLGTVGTGVARLLLEQADRITRRCGRPVTLRHAVVREMAKPRGVSLPAGVLTDDWRRIVNDPETAIVVHLVGGTTAAREIMTACLEAGKDVVTANKALLCEHGDEIFRLARRRGRTVAFEAAVAGGIPIIATVTQAMAANQITGIEAILNGTSNFILSEMLSQDRSYDESLRQAQQLGYAEADPTMDVDGTDAAQKLVILAQLAFGTRVPLGSFPRQGIDALDLADLRYAAELGYTIKLLAVAKLTNGHLEMHVQPTLVRRDRPVAQTHGPANIIALEGDAVGRTWYSGPGAGQMPTASAVVADLIDTATGRARITFPLLDVWGGREPLPVQPPEEIVSRYYMRFNVEDRPHVFAEIADILGRNRISLASIIQHEAPETDEADTPEYGARAVVPVVVMTHRTRLGCIRQAEAEFSKLPTLRQPWIWLPVAD
jgi:homoserine dehydrogenase